MVVKDNTILCPICGEYVDEATIVKGCGVINYMCAECFMKVDVDKIGECSV